MTSHKESFLKTQAIPLALTVVAFVVLSALLYLEIVILNHFTVEDIALKINPVDIGCGGR